MTTKTPPTRVPRRSSRPRAATTPRPSSPARPRADPTRVTLAAVIGAHGVAGEAKLKLFTADLSRYAVFNDGALTLTSLRGVIARFAEVPDRAAAEALGGTALTIPRADLPPLAEGEYYHADLIGLPVLTREGEAIGYVVTVENFGAGDVIEIERSTGKTFMAPLRPEAVPEWDADRLILDPAYDLT